MSRFTTHFGIGLLEYSTGRPVVRGDAALWHGTSPLVWEFGRLGSGDLITVPAFHPAGLSDRQLWLIAAKRARAPGVTDLGSVPPAFRWFANPAGPGVKPFHLHDHLYVSTGEDGRFTRRDADSILYEALIAVGVDPAQAFAIYTAVRLGGGGAWGT